MEASSLVCYSRAFAISLAWATNKVQPQKRIGGEGCCFAEYLREVNTEASCPSNKHFRRTILSHFENVHDKRYWVESHWFFVQKGLGRLIFVSAYIKIFWHFSHPGDVSTFFSSFQFFRASAFDSSRNFFFSKKTWNVWKFFLLL